MSPFGSAHDLLITFANSLDPDQAWQMSSADQAWQKAKRHLLITLQTVWSQIRPYKLSSADYICKQFGPRSGPTKCPLLIIFANSLNPDQAQQNVLCFANSLNPNQVRRNAKCSLHITFWTLIRPYKIMSADYICQQFGHRSGPTNVVCWSGLIKCKMSSADYICEQFWHSQASGNNYTWYIFKVFSTLQWKIDTYLYLPTLQNITADYICKQFGPRSGPTKCPLLIIFANSSDPDQAQQKVLCWLYLQTVWT